MNDDSPIIIYHTDDDKAKVLLYADNGSVWLNRNQPAKLFATSVPNISMHISNILKKRKLSEDSVIKYFLTTATDARLTFNDHPILQDKGCIRHAQIEAEVCAIYQQFDASRKHHAAELTDADNLHGLNQHLRTLKHQKEGNP